MDGQDQVAHHTDASRPALGFPLGTALLLIVVFCLSGVFSCCYHWDKLQALRRSFSGRSDADADANSIEAPAKPAPLLVDAKQSLNESLPVLMPGDRIPRYIAWPCPCEPPSRSGGEAMAVVVQTPPFRNS